MQNVSLAIFLSMKHNDKIENVLKELPNYIITKYIDGDNNLCDIVNAIKFEHTISFNYKNFPSKLTVQPYKIIYTNHSYYLYAIANKKIKIYDVSLITNIDLLKKFIKSKEIEAQIQNLLQNYGIKISNNKLTLKVCCKDKNALKKFIKYFESKGKINGLKYEVSSNSENELFYPLFRISTNDYVILNEEFKAKYIDYLEKYLLIIKRK